MKVRTDAQREANREAVRRWYASHREEKLAYCREWAAAHPEARRETVRRYYYRHREDYPPRGRRRRERIAHLGGAYTFVSSDTCYLCGEFLSGEIHLDHNPSLSWAIRHQEYLGPFTIHPTHPSCNLQASAHEPRFA